MFSSFQVYVKNNIFKIPTNILLPEDKVRELCSEVAWLCYSHVIKIPWLGNLIFLVCFVGKLEVIGWILVNQKAFLFALISSASYTVKSPKSTCSSGIGLMMDKTHLSNIKSTSHKLLLGEGNLDMLHHFTMATKVEPLLDDGQVTYLKKWHCS